MRNKLILFGENRNETKMYIVLKPENKSRPVGPNTHRNAIAL